MKDFKLIRLVSGEEIICVLEENKTHYIIKDGYNLIAPEPGKIGFIPFMAYTKQTKTGIKILKEHVMFVTEPLDSLADQVRGESSGILTPDKRIVS